MIPLTICVLSLSLAGTTLFLLYRLRQSNRTAARLASGNPSGDELTRELIRLLALGIDTNLLTEAGPAGLGDIEISCREFQDPYRNLDELLTCLEKNLAAQKSPDVSELIKYLFQIQSSLTLPFAEIDRCLGILGQRMKGNALAGNPIARIEVVVPGSLLDSRKMMALNSGTHVKQPLGVVALDLKGNVLKKAKVICT